MARKVEVCAYNPDWDLMFKEEVDKLKRIFGNEIVDIHHIGSTSVSGLHAKPIIDIMPVVQNINHIDKYNEEMKNIGYEPRGENGLPGRRYYRKGGDHRSHHVHIYQDGSFEITRHIAFREYLRSHLDAKKEYGELKKRLAQQFPYDIDSYITGKEQLVREIEVKAMKWYQL
ncbi:GrpB family protein [Ornithinibacillus sp. L9]|uniref:GrpB family protein n=1 Tax=Ornithinibacillus caprae TaxID=2678566 RepID=A0A6N8FEQ0_9BACI|nr:GrpB family protein [Ornithinibacillus caprae]MUK87895.1 GrpB family protein [Ornithinibacillus caprae]